MDVSPLMTPLTIRYTTKWAVAIRSIMGRGSRLWNRERLFISRETVGRGAGRGAGISLKLWGVLWG